VVGSGAQFYRWKSNDNLSQGQLDRKRVDITVVVRKGESRVEESVNALDSACPSGCCS